MRGKERDGVGMREIEARNRQEKEKSTRESEIWRQWKGETAHSRLGKTSLHAESRTTCLTKYLFTVCSREPKDMQESHACTSRVMWEKKEWNF